MPLNSEDESIRSCVFNALDHAVGGPRNCFQVRPDPIYRLMMRTIYPHRAIRILNGIKAGKHARVIYPHPVRGAIVWFSLIMPDIPIDE